MPDSIPLQPSHTRSRRPPENFAAILDGIEKIQPVRRSWSYQLWVVVVAVVMILLPLIYLGIILAIFVGLYFHVVYSIAIFKEAEGRSVMVAFIAYVAPIVSGIVVVMFMLKPLFARRQALETPLSLDPKQEPLLFSFVHRISLAIDAPTPRRIDIDTNVNASAGFRRGLASMFSDDLVLTIGLPLIAGLNTRQLAGIIAHELGHFAQRGGMRLSLLIRSINAWFAHAVYARDAWDEKLARWNSGTTLDFIVFIVRGAVWLVRKLLQGFMIVGHAVSGYLSREMEFDADRYTARLVGSEIYQQNSERISQLSAAAQWAHQDLGDFYREGRLVDDFSQLINFRSTQLPPDVVEAIDKERLGQRTRWTDTHPADLERQHNSERERANGVFRIEKPATGLFRDFDATSREATVRLYKLLLGDDLDLGCIHPMSDLLEKQKEENADFEALSLFFKEAYSPGRPIKLDPLPPKESLSSKHADFQRQLRSRMHEGVEEYKKRCAKLEDLDVLDAEIFQANEFLAAQFTIVKDAFSVPLTTASEVEAARSDRDQRLRQLERELTSFEQIAQKRLRLGLALYRKRRADDPGAIVPIPGVRMSKVFKSAGRLYAIYQAMLDLHHTIETIVRMGSFLENANDRAPIINRIKLLATRAHRRLDPLTKGLGDAPYTFEHHLANTTLASFLFQSLPGEGDVDGLVVSVRHAVSQYPRLHARVLGRLCRYVLEEEERLEAERGAGGKTSL